jgi:hypothetical protein
MQLNEECPHTLTGIYHWPEIKPQTLILEILIHAVQNLSKFVLHSLQIFWGPAAPQRIYSQGVLSL